jgi:chemotaxis protein MotB
MDDDALVKPEPPDMAWLLTFADLVSLLITFFVLLYSMKVVDESRWDVLKGALSGVFAREEAVVVIHPEEFDSSQVLTQFPADSLPYLENVLKVEFKNDPVLGALGTVYNPGEDSLTLSIPSTMLFETGEIRLKREGRIAIIKLADKLRHLDNRIHVEGHSDPAPFGREDVPTNWELAMLRAIMVAQVLHERGVQRNVPAFSYGDSRFGKIDSNLPEAERYTRARRVDIVIYGDGQNNV